MKPENILVDWASDEERANVVTSVALGDFDIAFNLQEPRQTRRALGNAMWRSPVGQTGRGLSKASDIFSFGLVVSSSHLSTYLGLPLFIVFTVHIRVRGGGLPASKRLQGVGSAWSNARTGNPDSTLLLFWSSL